MESHQSEKCARTITIEELEQKFRHLMSLNGTIMEPIYILVFAPIPRTEHYNHTEHNVPTGIIAK